MNTHASFVRSIVQTPEDDGPRLVFADWLEEQGEAPRAELIRIQCELARGVEERARFVQLRVRERELVKQHADKWLGPLATTCYVARDSLERGMIRELLFGMAEFLRPKMQRTAIEWFARAGVLGVALTNRTKSLPDLFSSPLLTDLCSLTLRHVGLGDGSIHQLVAGNACENLRSFTWFERQASGAGVRHLAQTASLKRLTSLTLGQIPFDSAALQAVLESPHLGSLTSLCLAETTRWKDDLPALGRSSGWQKLRELALRDVDLNGDELRSLLGAGGLAGLRILRLSGNSLRSSGVDVLAEDGALTNLERLDFSLDRDFDTIDLSHLLKALDHLPALKHLQLSAPVFGSLSTYLAHLSRLESLELSYCNLELPSFQTLLASKKLARLRTLTIDGNDLDSKTLPSLLRGAHRPKLRELQLCVEGSSAEAALVILDSGAYPGLIRLHVNGKEPSARDQVKLQRQYPQVLLEF